MHLVMVTIMAIVIERCWKAKERFPLLLITITITIIVTIIITIIIIIKRYWKSKERPPLLFRQVGKIGRPVRGLHDEVAYCVDVPGVGS